MQLPLIGGVVRFPEAAVHRGALIGNDNTVGISVDDDAYCKGNINPMRFGPAMNTPVRVEPMVSPAFNVCSRSLPRLQPLRRRQLITALQ